MSNPAKVVKMLGRLGFEIRLEQYPSGAYRVWAHKYAQNSIYHTNFLNDFGIATAIFDTLLNEFEGGN